MLVKTLNMMIIVNYELEDIVSSSLFCWAVFLSVISNKVTQAYGKMHMNHAYIYLIQSV